MPFCSIKSLEIPLFPVEMYQNYSKTHEMDRYYVVSGELVSSLIVGGKRRSFLARKNRNKPTMWEFTEEAKEKIKRYMEEKFIC